MRKYISGAAFTLALAALHMSPALSANTPYDVRHCIDWDGTEDADARSGTIMDALTGNSVSVNFAASAWNYDFYTLGGWYDGRAGVEGFCEGFAGARAEAGDVVSFTFSAPVSNPGIQVSSLGRPNGPLKFTVTADGQPAPAVLQILHSASTDPNPIVNGNEVTGAEAVFEFVIPGNYSTLELTVDTAVSDATLYALTSSHAEDSDGDGIVDLADLDDDNDGISDDEESRLSADSKLVDWNFNDAANEPAGRFVEGIEYTQDISAGAGLDLAFPGTKFSVANVDSTTTADAIAMDDYVQFGFTVGNQPLHMDQLKLRKEGGSYTFSLAMSDNNFASSTMLVTDGVMPVALADNSRPAYSFAPQELAATRAYQFRMYFHSVDPAVPFVDDINLYYRQRESVDTDADGIPNHLDLDSDNDGISDLVESGDNAGIDQDSNNDGILDLTESSDTDADGLMDIYEDADLAQDTGTTPISSDGDGIEDYLDLDSDNDGLTDAHEAGGADVDGNGEIDGFADANSDGFDDATATTPLALNDFDTDNLPDYRDIDSDNDGLTDTNEAGGIDADSNGMIDSFTDADANGLDDAIDGAPLASPDSDADGAPNNLDLDSDADGIPDAIEGNMDTDGNSVPDYLDTDSDGDSIPDSVEAGADPSAPVDSDGDGMHNFLDVDSDNDGIPDNMEAGPDPLTPADSEGDGMPDYVDTDSDNDGLSDMEETGGVDADGDGEADSVVAAGLLLDSDGDGIPDFRQPAAPTNPSGNGSAGLITGVNGFGGCAMPQHLGLTGAQTKIDPTLPMLGILAMIGAAMRRRSIEVDT